MAAGDVVSISNPYRFNIQSDTNIQARFAQKHSVPSTMSVHTVSYDSGYSAYAVSNLGNGLTTSSSTTYATIQLTRGNNAVTSIYYNFGSLDIPDGATINSVTCYCACTLNYAAGTIINQRYVRLYSGSTAKGNSYTIPTSNSTSPTVFNFDAGTWTPEELRNAKIRLYGSRNTTNVEYNLYYRFFGCDILVSYTYNNADFIVNSRSEANGVTVYPTNSTVNTFVSGSTITTKPLSIFLSCSSMSGYTLVDNGTNVTNSATQTSRVSVSSTANGWTDDSSYTAFTQNTLYPIENAFKSSTILDKYAYLTLPTQKATYAGWLSFDLCEIENIPSWATINSVTCNIRYAVSSTTYISAIAMQLYSGTTAKGTAQTSMSATNSGTGGTSYQISAGSWTVNELKNLRLHVQVTRSGYTNDASFYLYGADVIVEYQASGMIYICNVASDHTVILRSS